MPRGNEPGYQAEGRLTMNIFNFVVTQPTATYIQPNPTPKPIFEKVDIPGPLLTTVVKGGLSASQFN